MYAVTQTKRISAMNDMAFMRRNRLTKFRSGQALGPAPWFVPNTRLKCVCEKSQRQSHPREHSENTVHRARKPVRNNTQTRTAEVRRTVNFHRHALSDELHDWNKI